MSKHEDLIQYTEELYAFAATIRDKGYACGVDEQVETVFQKIKDYLFEHPEIQWDDYSDLSIGILRSSDLLSDPVLPTFLQRVAIQLRQAAAQTQSEDNEQAKPTQAAPQTEDKHLDPLSEGTALLVFLDEYIQYIRECDRIDIKPLCETNYDVEGLDFFNLLFKNHIFHFTKLDAILPGDVRKKLRKAESYLGKIFSPRECDSIIESISNTSEIIWENRCLLVDITNYFHAPEKIKQKYSMRKELGQKILGQLDILYDARTKIYNTIYANATPTPKDTGQIDIAETITENEMKILRCLAQNPELKQYQADIEAGTNLSRNTISSLLNHLHELGFVIKEKRGVSITSKGLKKVS